jgi:hypothetical protein
MVPKSIGRRGDAQGVRKILIDACSIAQRMFIKLHD